MSGRFLEKNKMHDAYEVGGFTYGHPTIMSGVKGEIVSIGRFCSIAPGVIIILGAEHWPQRVSTYPFTGESAKCSSKGGVVIGNDVWIGLNACIMSGVTIGDGAVVGAYSVVTKDVKPYEIVAGNPARYIRFRFLPSQIDALLEIAWWNWDEKKLLAAHGAGDIVSEDIAAFIRKYKGE